MVDIHTPSERALLEFMRVLTSGQICLESSRDWYATEWHDAIDRTAYQLGFADCYKQVMEALQAELKRISEIEGEK